MKAVLLNYLLEASVCFEVLYMFHWLALQGTTLLQASRFYLLGMAMAAWLIPLLGIEAAVPMAETVPVLGRLSPQTITVTERPMQVATREITVSDVVLWVYLAGVAVFGVCFLWRLGRLLWFVCRAEWVRNGNHWQINTHGAWPASSFACFLFWDETAPLTAEAQEQVRRHELVHIREWHTFDVLYAELLRVIFWINPAVHLFKTQLQTLHEYRADAVAARQFGRPKYANLLTASLFRQPQPAFSHSFNQCSIKQRTAMLHKPATSHRRLWALVLALPLIGGLLSAFSFEQPVSTLLPDVYPLSITDTTGPKPILQYSAIRGGKAVSIEKKKRELSLKDFPDAIEVRALSLDPAAEEGNRYQVRVFWIYLVNGSRPLAKVEANGELASMEGIKKQAGAGMRLVLEVKEVVRIDNQGKETKTAVVGSPITSMLLVE